MFLDKVAETEYKDCLNIWELSVRATHNFLSEEDINYFKPLILNEFLPAVQLYCIKNKNSKIIGFMGVADRKVEMLFVLPDYFRQGIGTKLMQYALDELDINSVDVNEQNDSAFIFYRKLGFKVIERSEVDDMGKPYPILHLKVSTF
ncbi:GNAT family N-acetyltransferase [Desulfovibrio gilichinskyi]|uniref:Putative acetyltransferase n=1 Tax=Desulfovibrio gilichinskyi TaxID=1519643 RepID=A0A1X7DRR5_9BACT|nr:GNAT family N-acetyltransferase [Desulfovibrio gilichinskyi]SMF20346.1 putative acetyltransferase [Desulfovibrio gilichinskyi]